MAYAPVYPHDPVEEIASDVFMVSGSIRMNPVIRITRNMAVIRQDNELTLIDPIRLNDEGERQLRDLGTVKRIIRLGCFHGVDDPYYVDTFGAELWSQAGGTTYTAPAITKALTEESELPFADAELFCFKGLKQPEAVLLLEKDGGILFTCDAIQHYGNYGRSNLPARIMMPLIGFPKMTLIGPIWLKVLTPEGGSLKSEFERLLTLEFDNLLSAHGSYLRGGAHAAVEVAFKRAFE